MHVLSHILSVGTLVSYHSSISLNIWYSIDSGERHIPHKDKVQNLPMLMWHGCYYHCDISFY